ncbi:MAG: hypothetical protein EOO62_10945 [Hymenobacter sp.]|nr:MAG: hypothetical protein EOO62_10945 [Hymenobacter sp.]
MSPVLRKTLKIVGYPAATLVGVVALYYGVAQVLSRIPVAAEPTQEAATVPFFIYSNGVHTDLVMPVKSGLRRAPSPIKTFCLNSSVTIFRLIRLISLPSTSQPAI